MKNKINIELTKEQFSRLQYMQSIYMFLLTKFKFQILDYANAQKKANDMNKFLMELRMKFDEDIDNVIAKMRKGAAAKTIKMVDDMVENLSEDIGTVPIIPITNSSCQISEKEDNK